MDTTQTQIYELLCEIPLIDVHTHVDAAHLSARGLHDILLYHMVISDLYSAGCPDGKRLAEDPGEEEVERRIEQALPYLEYIQNTSGWWGMRIILKDLYGWERPISTANWREIHAVIRDKSASSAWPREILNKARIPRLCTELWRGRDGQANDVLVYSLEWAFFARCQWGQYDTALLELEHAWAQDSPGAPLPVTLGETKIDLPKRIHTLEDVQEAIHHYCRAIPYAKVINTAQHISTDINYRPVKEGEMRTALQRREKAGPQERDIYANYILETFLTELERAHPGFVFAFSFGAEPLPFETGSKLRAETVFEVANIIQRHPKLRFQAFLSSAHQNQAMCTLARELPNLSLAGYWWHNFFPSAIRKVISERLDMLAANKQVGFFSDAYCLDWAYAKSIIVKKQLAAVLADKIAQGQYTLESAARIARQILYESPQAFISTQP